MRKPTSPAPSSSISTGLGVSTPSLSTWKTLPFDHRRIFCPLHRAVDHAGQHDHAAIRIEPRVENQRLQRRSGSPFGGGIALHDRFQHIFHAQPGLGADQQRVLRSMPTACSIISLMRGMSALGRSILLMTGMMSSPLLMAR